MPQSVLCLITLLAVTSPVSSHADAAEAVERFLSAWNSGDMVRLRGEVRYPFMSLMGPGAMHVAERPEEFVVDFESMRRDNGWVRSELEPQAYPVVSESQVHVVCRWARVNSDGETYREGRVYYIVHGRESNPAIVFRMPLVSSEINVESAAAVRETIDALLSTWNAADNPGMAELMIFPHAFLLPGGSVRIAHEPAELATDFDALRENEGWDHSKFHDLDIVYADRNHAIAHVTFTRHTADGAAYNSVPAVYILSKTADEGRWGFVVRAVLGSVEGAGPSNATE